MAAKCQFCGCTEHVEDSIETLGKHCLHRCARCDRTFYSEPERPTPPSKNMQIIGDKVVLHCRHCKTQIVRPLSEYRSVQACPDPWTCRDCDEKGLGVRCNGLTPHYIRQAVTPPQATGNAPGEMVPV